MSIQEIEREVQKLKPNELAEFAVWFSEHQNALWDLQMAKDWETGLHADLVARALSEHLAGKTTPL